MSFSGSKFGRTCKLILETSSSFEFPFNLTIPDGLTIEFTISRQSFSSSQRGQFKIYGSAPGTRDSIYKDKFNVDEYRAIQFFAGYQDFMPRIFNGQILQAYSEKQKEETVTIIDSFDGGFPMTNGYTNDTNAGGLTAEQSKNVLARLTSSLPNVTGKVIIGSFPTKNMRARTLSGNTWDLIRQESEGQCTISDGNVYCLNTNEGLDTDNNIVDMLGLGSGGTSTIPVITSDTGLLGSPRRTGLLVEWDMLFEPRLQLFQIVDIQSTFNPRFNGPAKVVGFRHQGIISKAVNGECRTTASFIFAKNTSFENAML